VIERSLFRNNTTGTGGGGAPTQYSAFGGAVYNGSNSLAVTNSTFSDNKVFGFCGQVTQAEAYGGGIQVEAGTVSLSSVTLANNEALAGPDCNYAAGKAHGGNLSRNGGTLRLYNSIVSHAPGSTNAFGEIVDLGHNLSSDLSCSFTNLGSLNDTNPNLGPLDFYGGPTQTMPLLAESPAIDAGGPSAPSMDQRGRTRPFGPAADMGAFESSPPYVIRGELTGYFPPTGATVWANTTNIPAIGRRFSLENLGAGNHTVRPAGSNVVFAPSEQALTLGPDRIGIQFRGYQSNAVTLDLASPTKQIVFAAEAGSPAQLLTSTNLVAWDVLWSDFIPAGGLMTFEIGISNGQRRFFQGLRP
jgi:hypothetical protein